MSSLANIPCEKIIVDELNYQGFRIYPENYLYYYALESMREFGDIWYCPSSLYRYDQEKKMLLWFTGSIWGRATLFNHYSDHWWYPAELIK